MVPEVFATAPVRPIPLHALLPTTTTADELCIPTLGVPNTVLPMPQPEKQESPKEASLEIQDDIFRIVSYTKDRRRSHPPTNPQSSPPTGTSLQRPRSDCFLPDLSYPPYRTHTNGLPPFFTDTFISSNRPEDHTFTFDPSLSVAADKEWPLNVFDYLQGHYSNEFLEEDSTAGGRAQPFLTSSILEAPSFGTNREIEGKSTARGAGDIESLLPVVGIDDPAFRLDADEIFHPFSQPCDGAWDEASNIFHPISGSTALEDSVSINPGLLQWSPPPKETSPSRSRRRMKLFEELDGPPFYDRQSELNAEYFGQVANKIRASSWMTAMTHEPLVDAVDGRWVVDPRRESGPGRAHDGESVYVVFLDRRSKGAFVCLICGKKMGDRKLPRALDHIRGHFGHQPYWCTEAHNVVDHENNENPKKKTITNKTNNACGKSFPSQEKLDDHKRKALNRTNHPCPICGKPFSTSSNLNKHRRSAHCE